MNSIINRLIIIKLRQRVEGLFWWHISPFPLLVSQTFRVKSINVISLKQWTCHVIAIVETAVPLDIIKFHVEFTFGTCTDDLYVGRCSIQVSPPVVVKCTDGTWIGRGGGRRALSSWVLTEELSSRHLSRLKASNRLACRWTAGSSRSCLVDVERKLNVKE